MSRLNNVMKSIRKLPVLRRPSSVTDDLKRQYYWSLISRNKQLNLNIGTYYEAMEMPDVYTSINVITNRVLGLSYSIHSENEFSNNLNNVNYLTNLMANPMGLKDNETFYETYLIQMFGSALGPGDAFAVIHHDEVFDNVINGLEYIPMDWIQYYEDTDQWGLRYNNKRFESDEIIHFGKPGSRKSKWFKSPIDSLAQLLTLNIYGLKANINTFKDNYINPNGVLKYDADIDPEDIEREIERIEKDKRENPNGTLVIQGGEFINMGNTNKDMQYLEMCTMIRDTTFRVYGIPPAEAGIIESGNLGGGTADGQDKTMKKTLTAYLKLFERTHNRIFGRHGFEEVFRFEEIDLENKLQRAQIESTQLHDGVTYINEVRSGYGLDPVNWGNVPMNYPSFGLALTPQSTNINPLGEAPTDTDIGEAIKTVRLYKNSLYKNRMINYE